jgi:hypothetical protein
MSAERAESELLRPVEAHELHRRNSFWKYFWKAISALMLIIILSYMLTNYSVRTILAGKANSDVVNEGVLDSEYGMIVFTNGVYSGLKELYHENEKEFKACVLGEYLDGQYILDELFLPKMHFQDYDQVISSPCPDGTLIDLHSHPQQHCTFSEVDLNGFIPNEENTLLGVMCSDDRFILQK